MAYEVKNCSLTATDIELPFAMAGHSCAVNKDKLYVCSSEFDAMDLNCTVFDGKSFSPMGKYALLFGTVRRIINEILSELCLSIYQREARYGSNGFNERKSDHYGRQSLSRS